MTLDEIIKNYSGKTIKVTTKENVSSIGKICGYETKTESGTGKDVILLENTYRYSVYEIEIPDIISIEERKPIKMKKTETGYIIEREE